MTKEKTLNGKAIMQEDGSWKWKETPLSSKIREELEKGIKRNDVLPLDWAMDRIDSVLKEAVSRLKEKDLYRALINKYGKPKVYSCCTTELFDLIEEYLNEKIKEIMGEFE